MRVSLAASERQERRTDAIVSYSLLLLSTVFALFPIGWMLSTSFKSEAEALSLPIRWIPKEFTLQAYGEMWTLKPFARYFWNSLAVSGSTALISTIVGALAGYGFSRFRFRGRTSLLAFFLATQMISGVLVIGPYFQVLAAVELYNTLTGLVIAYVTICLPFAAWMSKGYFDSIPKELDEAGLVDGASRLQIFLRIICPIAVPGTVSTLLFAFLLAWQDLLWALCLISIDEKRTVTLGVAFLVGEFVIKWPMLTAASLIGSLPTIILYLF
ncbi:MAG TPA: carbohydrate ABC transporter permease, partial [Candidatus Methylomirabilis sp.]|nr:carbohydrate ABC transporter permease [Candidatus Methylomirabilis sp.]